MKVCFETFGCRLNRAEALQREAEYLEGGWTLTDRHDDADLVIVRGCSVTKKAQTECERLIAHIRRKYPTLKVKVEGCLKDPAQTSAARTTEKETCDFVGASVPKRTARGFLKVQDGCSRRCAYCIIPRFRGDSVSIPFESVIERAKRLRDEGGYGEIVVTGCNLSLYSSDGKNLAHLVDALSSLGGFRIRMGSIEPCGIASDIIRAMGSNANVCRSLHLSVQSASNSVLTAMKRPYLAKDVDLLTEEALSHIPGCGLGCDIITGFPGETELDFLATSSFLSRHPFSNAHIFPFSARPGTPAALSREQLPHEIKSARAKALAEISMKHRVDFLSSFKGRTVEVAVEDEARPSGWTSEYLRCTLKTAPRGMFPRKSLRRMKVIEISRGTLEAVHADA